MAEFVGTSGADTLIGTLGDDVLIANGGIDYLSGGGGADEYRLSQVSGTNLVTIEDLGGDGAIDEITGGRGLYASASLGYSAWATAAREGGDLVISLPGKPHRFHKPGYGPITIEITDHYKGEAVEYLTAGGVTYWLAAGRNGSIENDIIAGRGAGQLHKARAGDDFVDAGGGDDTIKGGTGRDTIFGGDGADEILGGSGADRLYGGAGDDLIKAGGGDDWIETGEGNNTVLAGSGHDRVYAGAGNDLIKGGNGWDVIVGYDGDDTLVGGNGGDTYIFGYDREALGTTDHWGHDLVKDLGNKAIYDTTIGTYGEWRYDTLEFYGLYGPSSGNSAEAIAKLRTARVGDDMVISTMDGTSSVTVRDQFVTGTDDYYVEQITFNGTYWSPILFRVGSAEHEDIGDDRGGKSQLNEFLFGTEGDDQIFSDSGYDLIWTGGGADVLVYKESDPEGIYDLDRNWISGGHVIDTVMDFDVARDQFDFAEIGGLGFGFEDLAIGEDGEGDATIRWNSGDIEIANISIELRGVSMADVTEDLFLFA